MLFSSFVLLFRSQHGHRKDKTTDVLHFLAILYPAYKFECVFFDYSPPDKTIGEPIFTVYRKNNWLRSKKSKTIFLLENVNENRKMENTHREQ